MSRRRYEWAIVRCQIRCSNGHDVERGQVVRWGMLMATCAQCLRKQGIEIPTSEAIRMAAEKSKTIRALG